MQIELWRSIADGGLLILIWMVQLIVYPSFRHVDLARFEQWHSQYTRRITVIVLPLMFAQVGLVGAQVLSQSSWHVIGSVVCVALAWVSTFALSVPCHERLRQPNAAEIERLIRTNWPRTILWTLTFGLGIYGLLVRA